MMPLNYAILKHFATGEDASTADVIQALKPAYGKFKMLRPNAVQEALMTAEQNGLLEESRAEMDGGNNLRIYYKITDYGKSMVTNYIKG